MVNKLINGQQFEISSDFDNNKNFFQIAEGDSQRKRIRNGGVMYEDKNNSVLQYMLYVLYSIFKICKKKLRYVNTSKCLMFRCG